MIILGIESSCDDTSVALVDSSEKGHFVISEKTASQIEIHKKYGGVVPEIAGRMHAEKIVPLIEEVLKDQPKPDAIAVTAGPGLITGLLVGTEAARTLSYTKQIPLIAVNHIDGHIHSPLIKSDEPDYIFPALALVVSGGHTELVLAKNHGEYQILGKTVDDAAGECFDKVAKLLELPYPGGPQISKLAQDGDKNAIDFPRPMLDSGDYRFSFAGLKTSALYWLRDNKLSTENISISNLVDAFRRQRKTNVNDFCASIEEAIVDVLVKKTIRAAEEFKPRTVLLVGGVSANKKLRERLSTEVGKMGMNFRVALQEYCMDNAAMIAVAAYFKAQKNQYTDWHELKSDPNWRIVN
jgi:N6-L-threonylcarbamoyladenine synthase